MWVELRRGEPFGAEQGTDIPVLATADMFVTRQQLGLGTAGGAEDLDLFRCQVG